MARQTPEGRVKDHIKKILRARGIWYFMPMQNGMGVVGIPDLICCDGGRFLAIETKAPGKVGGCYAYTHDSADKALTANQRARIREIREAEGVALVTDDPQAFKEWIDGFKTQG